MKRLGVRLQKELHFHRDVIVPIIATFPEGEPTLKSYADVAIGEAFSNLKRYNDGGVAIVHWSVNRKGCIVWIQAESYFVHYELLAGCLEQSKTNVQTKHQCNFLEEHHGLGHDLVARLTTKCHYDPEGRLVMHFKKDRLPDSSSLNLIALPMQHWQ